jgi:phosphoribosylglycinamide formyltransferase-1
VTRRRAAVLASGGGSNLQSLLDHLGQLGNRRALDVVVVASDRPDAGALERARRAGIPTETIASRRHPDATPLDLVLATHRVDLMVLAGYLQLVPPEVTRRFGGRMVNVHPGPLPQFGGAGMYGRRVHRAVLAANTPWSGPTVHLVDEIYDHGEVLAHWPVPVVRGDDEHTLGARVLRAEHLLFPRVIQHVAAALVAGSAVAPLPALPPVDLAADDPTLAATLDGIFPVVHP